MLEHYELNKYEEIKLNRYVRFAFEKTTRRVFPFSIMRGRHLSFVSKNLLIYTRSLFWIWWRGGGNVQCEGVIIIKNSKILLCLYIACIICMCIAHSWVCFTITRFEMLCYIYFYNLCTFSVSVFSFLFFVFVFLCIWLSRFSIYTCICPFTLFNSFFLGFFFAYFHFVTFFIVQIKFGILIE